MILGLIYLINLAVQIITLAVIADVVLSYFMSPYHPVRSALDRVVQPAFSYIRRYVPPVQNFDFSPLILLLLAQLLGTFLVNILKNL